MKHINLILALAFIQITPLPAHEPTLILMGGSYQTCSSLDNDDCKPEQKQFPDARQPSQYQIDPQAFAAILDPSYWAARDRPPPITAIESMLEAGFKSAGNKTYSSADLMRLFESIAPNTWRALVVSEQDLILSAFELPQYRQGKRLKEGAALDGSIHGFDATMFRRLVIEAAKRSPDRKPRIAFVTSAAANNFDAVDFYRELLQQAGAEVVWWPVDASMNSAIFGKQGCDALPQLRLQLFSQLGRERVFPDLDNEQREACKQADRLAQVPLQVDALFLDGGDQWLHWNTFFTSNGQPNLWLQNIRTAFHRGDLVVAGTSAGAAVQSGPVMITNGTSSNALKRGAKQYGSMAEGCEAANRCPDGLQEDDLTFWPQGGFDLAGPLLMDTHVSKRNRELRLLTLLDAVNVEAGIGVDETSAVMLRFEKSKLHVEALGMSGAWWFSKPTADNAQGSYSLSAHYLAPGTVLQWQHGRMQSMHTPLYPPTQSYQSPAIDALTPNAMRDAVWNMLRKHNDNAALSAQGRSIVISSSPDSHYWQGPQDQQGITNLHIKVSSIESPEK